MDATRKLYRFVTLALLLSLLLAPVTSARAAPGSTVRVSLAYNGAQGNGKSGGAALSANGLYVAFESYATNLVIGDTNGAADVFVRAWQGGAVQRVSVSSLGVQGNGFSFHPLLSANGRLVVFSSYASNLVAGDTNADSDIFVRDWQAGTTERVSLTNDGAQADRGSLNPSISDTGRFVAFSSDATNMVTGDTNTTADIFLRDRQGGTTERLSVDSAETQANGHSGAPWISANGRYVAFESSATNLVSGDTNGLQDIFVRDRLNGSTTRVSLATGGA